jgi:hypothetical protein
MVPTTKYLEDEMKLRWFLLFVLSTALFHSACGGSGSGSSTPHDPPTYGHGEWTWESGPNVNSEAANYGTQGVAASTNIPGARFKAVSWSDADGNFWLFGGDGAANSMQNPGYLNDLWRYTAGEWTWMGGTNLGDQLGIYGAQGTASPDNIPGGRGYASGGVDSAGNLWLFGGAGYGSTGSPALPPGYLNDLWKYSAGEWTWVSGSNINNQKGVYGTQGIAYPTHVPGARTEAVSWIDASGNFFLFGGYGYDSTGNMGFLNDLWKYSAGEWTWINGSNLVNQPGTYGTLGSSAPTNIPSARNAAVSWTDASGNFWLFGGFGYDSSGTNGFLNDLWEYSAGQWKWVNGSNLVGATGTYGTQGQPSSSNVPAARRDAVSWTDASGNLWLFGGFGPLTSSYTNPIEDLNDFWKYNAGQWTWMGGSNTPDQSGIYGTQGTPAPSNVPGARVYPTGWTDASGNLWLFSGTGYDSAGNDGGLNDLWMYQP